MTKSAARAALLAYTLPPPKAVEIGGKTHYLRKPTVGEKGELVRKAGIKPGSDDVDTAKLKSLAVCLLAVTENGERLLEDTDLAVVMDSPAGGVLEQLAEAALGMLNADVDAAKKNSSETESEPSSSPSP